jgi:DNA-binding SARP family transcriptional activator
MTATREEVIDALWPEIDPVAAVNSLNQTVYFLRRVFEPEYEDDTSPGFLHQESDLVFLDGDLVTSASGICARLIASYDREPTPETAGQLAETYAGRFAADFSYEEWASDYRDWLHVAYLQIIETEIAADVASGRYLAALRLARRALEVDPRLETLGLSLLKVLKGSGAHSAAAEQYERYATLLRAEIGVEPPAFTEV